MVERLAAGGNPPDAGIPTLHVRCGSDIKAALSEAGFSGDFLEYSDAICQGPVLDTPDWLDCRAAFLATAYGAGVQLTQSEILARLQAAEADLQSAATRYPRVVLWFEHDGYDQLILARCLAQWAHHPPPTLEQICIDRFPGIPRFIGLGQLTPSQLRSLWDNRQLVTPAQRTAGALVWQKLCEPDPNGLATLARNGCALPFMAAALRRHCQELPWADGLGLTERLILRQLAARSMTAGEVFRNLMQGIEPLPWQTDLLVWLIIRSMVGVFDVSGPPPWPKQRLTITREGHAVLAGKLDYLSLNPPARYLGAALASAWTWDDERCVALPR